VKASLPSKSTTRLLPLHLCQFHSESINVKPKNTRNGGPDVDPYRKAAPVTLDSLIIAEATAGKEVLLKAAALALTAYVNVSDYLKEYVMEQFHCLALEVVRKGPGRQEEIPSTLFRDGEEAKLLVEALG